MSVVVPTIGRPSLLAKGLRSILDCDPGPSEVIVVDQSTCTKTKDLVADCGDVRVRRVACSGRGAALARNIGVRSASHDVVMFTDDDCHVAVDWVGVAFRHLLTHPGAIVTGQVLAGVGGDGVVPSTIADVEPRDWTGILSRGALYSGNMAGDRNALCRVGPFDERRSLRLAAEDNDLCFRWVRSGGRLLYAPDMVVWHEDWRSPAELRTVYSRYARGQGAFYAKHLVRGDTVIARFVVEDLRRGFRVRAARILKRRRNASMEALAILPWMLVGIADGLVDSVVHAVAHWPTQRTDRSSLASKPAELAENATPGATADRGDQSGRRDRCGADE